MPLTLTVKSYQRLSPAQDSSKILGDGSLLIGRGSEADWVLPDPERQISKVHCRVDKVGEDFVLTDSSTNGVFINNRGAAIGRDNKVTLEPGDQIRLGDYEIDVAISEDAGAVDDIAGQDITAGPLPALEDPFSDPLLAGVATAETGSHDEALTDVPTPGYLDEPALFELDQEDQAPPSEQPRLLGVPVGGEDPEPGPPPGATPDHLPGDRAFFQTPNLMTDAARPAAPQASGGLLSAADPDASAIPDDWDEEGAGDLQGQSGVPPTALPATPLASGTIPDDWSLDTEPPDQAPAPAAGAQIPDDWDLEGDQPERSPGPPTPPAASRPEEDPIAPEIAGPEEPLDPAEVTLGGEAAHGGTEHGLGSAATESTMLDGPSPAMSSPMTAPGAAPGSIEPDPIAVASTAAEVRRPTPGPRAAVAPNSTGVTPTQALRAFLEGAELDPPPMNEEEVEDLLRTLGEVYRIMVQGMIEVLAARTSLKNEFRVEQTMIRPVQNNPLKFSLNVDNAMENLLTKRGKGYMSPVTAMQEGFADLQAHQIATLAGMQSALKSVLLRFDPDELEQRLEGSSVLESILPGKRKARYWDTFQELYRDIAREAEDDFQKLFGQAFAEAYEKEIKKQ